jgi:hypothetical protein
MSLNIALLALSKRKSSKPRPRVLAGIAIKLGLCKHYYFDTWSFSHDTLATACETMAKIQGVDLSAQVECW